MPDIPLCQNTTCQFPLEPTDLYCAQCGQPTGHIEWSFSLTPSPSDAEPQFVPADQPVYLVARNTGISEVKIDLKDSKWRGLKLQGSTRRLVHADRPDHPAQPVAYKFIQDPEQKIAGKIAMTSEDGERDEEKWWIKNPERKSSPLRPPRPIPKARWVVGSPVVVFPPGVSKQQVFLWNDAIDPRQIETNPSPDDYDIKIMGVSLNDRKPRLGPRNNQKLTVEAIGVPQNREEVWEVVDDLSMTFLRLPTTKRDAGPMVIVAIDFGTRNTSLRVRWRRYPHNGATPVPPDTIDIISDRENEETLRFPTQMILDTNDPTFFLWGTAADEYSANNRMTATQVVIDNLKTHLRVGEPLHTHWTNQALLDRYFRRVFESLNAYFKKHSLDRSHLFIRYVITRPILDHHDEDKQGQAYETMLRNALLECGVKGQDILFVLEPFAAAVGILREADRYAQLQRFENRVIAVVDSGGGTTDVALVRLSIEEGQIKPELVGSYALQLQQSNWAMEALRAQGATDRLELGGNTLDHALVYLLKTHPDVLLDSPRGNPTFPLPIDDQDKRGFERICRRVKERFVTHSSSQYLNKAEEDIVEGEELLFPTVTDLEGVRIEHSFFVLNILQPILTPVITQLIQQIEQDNVDGTKASITDVQHVYYVGGTNIDPFVRQHFGRGFSEAQKDVDLEDDISHTTRLNAVVNGTVWCDEQVFPTSPFTLHLRWNNEEILLVKERDPLYPEVMAHRLPLKDTRIDYQNELDAALIASEGGLPEKQIVALAFYRNNDNLDPDGQYVEFAAKVSEKGAMAELYVDGVVKEQWCFLLKKS